MTDEIDKVEIADEDIHEEDFSPEVLESEETDWKAEAEKLKGIAKRRATQLKKFKEREKAGKTSAEAAKIAVDIVKDSQSAAPKTGELDETTLDYLDLKGINEDEDIKVIQDVVKKTGMTVRQALKDDYVTSKLEANKNARIVREATPSATKRAGSQSDGFDTALAKFEKDGTLPDDFELRKKVVNAKYRQEKGNQPSWHT